MPLSGIATSPRERYRRMVNRRLQRYLRAMLIGLGLLPWWLPLARAYLPLDMLWQILDQLFIVVCHRLPARSIELAGVAMPLCTRCAGIFGGLALAAIVARPRVSLRAARWLLLLAGLLMLADVLRQDLGSGGIIHPLRILSGVLVGYAATLGLLAALRGPQLPALREPQLDKHEPAAVSSPETSIR